MIFHKPGVFPLFGSFQHVNCGQNCIGDEPPLTGTVGTDN